MINFREDIPSSLLSLESDIFSETNIEFYEEELLDDFFELNMNTNANSKNYIYPERIFLDHLAYASQEAILYLSRPRLLDDEYMGRDFIFNTIKKYFSEDFDDLEKIYNFQVKDKEIDFEIYPKYQPKPIP